jgi:hypothetical protein
MPHALLISLNLFRLLKVNLTKLVDTCLKKLLAFLNLLFGKRKAFVEIRSVEYAFAFVLEDNETFDILVMDFLFIYFNSFIT